MPENTLPAFVSNYVATPDQHVDFDMGDKCLESFFPGSDMLARAGTLPNNGAGTEFR